MTVDPSQRRVLIAGARPGGLPTAIALERAGISYLLLGCFPELRAAGDEMRLQVDAMHCGSRRPPRRRAAGILYDPPSAVLLACSSALSCCSW